MIFTEPISTQELIEKGLWTGTCEFNVGVWEPEDMSWKYMGKKASISSEGECETFDYRIEACVVQKVGSYIQLEGRWDKVQGSETKYELKETSR